MQVGIAAELPSGDLANTNFDYPRFNKFLLDGGQSYVRIPKERFNVDSCVSLTRPVLAFIAFWLTR